MKQTAPVLFFLFLSAAVFGEIRLPEILSDGMLLQRGVEIPVWGMADPGEKITVHFAGRTRIGVADKNGRFLVKLSPLEASNVNREMIVSGKNVIRIKDVLVGDVWLCSGQSNMDFCLDAGTNKREERLAAKYPEIRLFYVRRAHAFTPQFHTKSAWKRCENWHAAVFSAVGYFFGRELYRTLGIPIGLIDASYGGTPIEPWFSREKYEATPAIRERQNALKGGDKGNRGAALGYADPAFDDSSWETITLPRTGTSDPLMKTEGEFWLRKHLDIPADWNGNLDRIELGLIFGIDTVYLHGVPIASTGYDAPFYWERLHTYRNLPKGIAPQGKTVLAIRIFGKNMTGWKQMLLQRYDDKIPRKKIDLSGEWKFKRVYTLPPEEANHDHYTTQPTALYNAMIAPLQPYPIKGAIWYQGESNVGKHKTYHERLKTMVELWRKEWGLGELPFYYVEIAPFGSKETNGSAFLRESQFKAQSIISNSGMISTNDLVEEYEKDNIHPKNKTDVGKRLAYMALKRTYGFKGIEDMGPVYKSMEVKDGIAILSFENAKDGFNRLNGMEGFEIAGEDKVFYPAEAEVYNNLQIKVKSDKVKNPVAVRYCFRDFKPGNVANLRELPMYPFRTDNWE